MPMLLHLQTLCIAGRLLRPFLSLRVCRYPHHQSSTCNFQGTEIYPRTRCLVDQQLAVWPDVRQQSLLSSFLNWFVVQLSYHCSGDQWSCLARRSWCCWEEQYHLRNPNPPVFLDPVEHHSPGHELFTALWSRLWWGTGNEIEYTPAGLLSVCQTY